MSCHDVKNTRKSLGVAVSDKSVTVSEHVQQAISASSQALHAARILRAHCTSDIVLQMIFQTTVIAELLHASCTWWGFATPNNATAADVLKIILAVVLARIFVHQMNKRSTFFFHINVVRLSSRITRYITLSHVIYICIN